MDSGVTVTLADERGGPDVGRPRRRIQAIARWMVVGAAVLAPWLFGSSEPWSCFLIGFLVLGAGILWLVSLVVWPATGLRCRALSVLLVGLLLLMLIQILPLPARWVEILNPVAASTTLQARELLDTLPGHAMATDVSGAPQWLTLSVSPNPTRMAIYVYGLGLLAFLVTLNCARRWPDIERMARVILVGGFLLIVAALVHSLSGSRELLWFHVPRHMEYGFGTYSNRSHFASYVLTIFGVACGLYMAASSFVELRKDAGQAGGGVAWLSTRTGSRLALLVFVLVICLATVFMALSRGAVVALLGALALGAFLPGRKQGRVRSAYVVGVMVLVVIVWLGWKPVIERLGSLTRVAADPASDYRTMAVQDTLLLFGSSPWVGCGFGTFQHIFPTVARPDLQFGLWVHAHSDWIEWLAEGGVVALLMVLSITGLALREVLSGLRNARIERRRFAWGCMIGVLAVGLHSAVDFSLRKPANGIMFAVLAGMALAAVQRRAAVAPVEAGTGPGVIPEPTGSAIPGGVIRTIACVFLAITTAAWFRSAFCFTDALALKRVEYLDRMYLKSSDRGQKSIIVSSALEDAERAKGIVACRPDEISELLVLYFRWSVDPALAVEVREKIAQETLRMAVMMVQAAPSDFMAWLWLARATALTGQWEASAPCLDRAQALRPGRRLGNYLPNFGGKP